MSLNIIFAGTPHFAVPSLQALINSSHRVMAVYTQPDRPAGRGREITSSPVKILAQSAQLPIYQPQTLRDAQQQKQLRELNADVMIVVAYGLILPREILEIPRLGCINVHASLLPRWRGAAPIQHSILAGDEKTGVTIMQMNEGLDTGDILSQKSCEINSTETSGDLYERLATMGAELLLKTLAEIENKNISPQPQDNQHATHAPKIQKKDAQLNWHLPAENLARAVRAYNPVPIAFTIFNGQPLRIWQAIALPEKHTTKPGTLIRASKDGIDVAAKENILRILQLQMPGKTPQSAADFFHAYHAQLIPMQTAFIVA